MKQGLILDVSPELCVKLDYMKALCQLSLPFHDQPENFSNINFCSNDFINAWKGSNIEIEFCWLINIEIALITQSHFIQSNMI